MHEGLLAEQADGSGALIGGLPLLSGCPNKVRAEQNSVIYAISGDMLQGSIIDSDFKAISTIEIMNHLVLDIVGLGNHEADYGVLHLLFREKIADFPVANADLHIKPCNKRIMGAFVDIWEASDEVGRICNAYRSDEIDLAILLTHLGFESDKELAAALDHTWGVDIIVGGHSHTAHTELELVNGVLIVYRSTNISRSRIRS